MKTDELIRTLAKDAPRVRRLRHPLIRAGLWVLVALAILTVLTLVHGPRPEFDARLRDPLFTLGMVSALITGIAAAVAVFHISLPDRSRFWLLLPGPPLLLWLGTVGYQCFGDWVPLGPGRAALELASDCFGTLVATSAPLSLLLIVMMRHAAHWRAGTVAVMGGIAVSGLTASALTMFHPLDATVMILVWNLGTLAVIAGVTALLGRWGRKAG